MVMVGVGFIVYIRVEEAPRLHVLQNADVTCSELRATCS